MVMEEQSRSLSETKPEILGCLVPGCDEKSFSSQKMMFFHVLTQHPLEYLEIKRKGWRQMMVDLPGSADSIIVQTMQENEILAPPVQEIQQSPPISPFSVCSSKEFNVEDQINEPLKTSGSENHQSTDRVSQPSTPLCDEVADSAVGIITVDPTFLLENVQRTEEAPITFTPTILKRKRNLSSASLKRKRNLSSASSQSSQKGKTNRLVESATNSFSKYRTRDNSSSTHSSQRSGNRSRSSSRLSPSNSVPSRSGSSCLINKNSKDLRPSRLEGFGAAQNLNANSVSPLLAWNPEVNNERNNNDRIVILRHQCLFCPLTFNSVNDVMDHDMNDHQDQWRFPCTMCNTFVAKSSVILRKHLMSRAHNLNWSPGHSLRCPFCRKPLAGLRSFEQHVHFEYDTWRQRVYEELQQNAMVTCVHCLQCCLNKQDFEDHFCLKNRSNELIGKFVGKFVHRLDCGHAQKVCSKFPSCCFEICESAHPTCKFDSKCNDSLCRFFHSRNIRANSCWNCSNL